MWRVKRAGEHSQKNLNPKKGEEELNWRFATVIRLLLEVIRLIL
jgi:hypothetical protein